MLDKKIIDELTKHTKECREATDLIRSVESSIERDKIEEYFRLRKELEFGIKPTLNNGVSLKILHDILVSQGNKYIIRADADCKLFISALGSKKYLSDSEIAKIKYDSCTGKEADPIGYMCEHSDVETSTPSVNNIDFKCSTCDQILIGYIYEKDLDIKE